MDKMNIKNKIFVMLIVLILSSFTTEKKVITVFMVGDSTMSNKPLIGGNQERGWGHMLGGFFTEEVYVENHARNGRSSKSFISEGHWDEVLKRLSPGDYVIIQFGHNDEKADRARHTEPGTTFDENLRRFVRDTRARGATPILLNAIVRRNFVSQMDSSFVRDVRKIPDNKESVVEGNILFDTHGAYLESPRNVAHEMKVPFVDANRITHDLISSMGPEKSKELYMWIEPNAIVACPQGRQDNTHLSVYGARIIAKLLIDAIAREVPALGKYVRYYDFVVAKDGSGDFFTLQEAINSVPDFRLDKRTNILIRPGIYDEKLIVPTSKVNVSLLGQSDVVISHSNHTERNDCWNVREINWGTAICYVFAPGFCVENVTFHNDSQSDISAITCFIAGDNVKFEDCFFKGKKNVLYCIGSGIKYFKRCKIEGIPSFIHGGKKTVLNECVIIDKENTPESAEMKNMLKKISKISYRCTLQRNTKNEKIDSQLRKSDVIKYDEFDFMWNPIDMEKGFDVSN